MRILVLGGDGYLGWPTALHFSARGHEVTVVDNLVRREYDREMGVESLVPIVTLDERIAAWREVSGKEIGSYIGDLCEAPFVHEMVRDFDAALHRIHELKPSGRGGTGGSGARPRHDAGSSSRTRKTEYRKEQH